MLTLLALVMRGINLVNRLIGNVFSWLALAIVLVCFWVVVERYVFSTTRLWMQDLYPWMNGIMFTAVAGYALYRNDHVRVDIFFRPAPVRRKALMDLIGVTLFLMPFAWAVYEYCYNFVARSWRIFEASPNPGGMDGFWVVKSFILVFAAVIALQGISMAIRSILILADREDLVPDDYRYKYDVTE